MISLSRNSRLIQFLKNVISGWSVGQQTSDRCPQMGHSQNLSNAGNFAGVLNTDNHTDRPEMTFFKICISIFKNLLLCAKTSDLQVFRYFIDTFWPLEMVGASKKSVSLLDDLWLPKIDSTTRTTGTNAF